MIELECLTEEQTNLLLSEGWTLKEVRPTTSKKCGFVYTLVNFKSHTFQ